MLSRLPLAGPLPNERLGTRWVENPARPSG